MRPLPEYNVEVGGIENSSCGEADSLKTRPSWQWMLLGAALAALVVVPALIAFAVARTGVSAASAKPTPTITVTVPPASASEAPQGDTGGSNQAQFVADMRDVGLTSGGEILGFSRRTDQELLETGLIWCGRLASGDTADSIAQVGDIRPEIGDAMVAGINSAHRNLCPNA